MLRWVAIPCISVIAWPMIFTKDVLIITVTQSYDTCGRNGGCGSGPGLQDRLPHGCGSRAYREVFTACLAARGRMPRFSIVAEFQ